MRYRRKKSCFQDLATVLDGTFARGHELGKSRWLARICLVWEEVVGDDNAKDHHPARFFYKDKVLHVACRSAMHAATLQLYIEEIRLRLNRTLGKSIVREIRLKQSSHFFHQPAPPKPTICEEPAHEVNEEKIAKTLIDSGLTGDMRQSFEKLLRKQPDYWK